MKRALPIFLDTLYTLALALWFGLAAGLLVAAARPGPPDATLSLFVQRAGGLTEAAGVVMVGVQFLLRRRYARVRQLMAVDGLRQLLTMGALLLAEFGRYGLFKPGHALVAHDIGVLCQLAGVQIAMLAAVTAITSWLLVPRTTIASAVAAAPTPTSTEPLPPSLKPTPPKSMKPKAQNRRK
jgi:hypothetical protein